ncbi:MAG: hypothetical protein JST68_14560 [Bacteroidetes bacterium]|nr:hypothetical protein [Bacteroidota bacterium]
MLITFEVVVNPIILLLAIVTGAIVGYVIGRAKIAKSESKLQKLETELMYSHQETLESQQALVELQSRLRDQSIPVIPMKINGTPKENPKEKATK